MDGDERNVWRMEVTLPESNTETLTQRLVGSVATASFDCIDSGLLMLFGGGMKRKRKLGARGAKPRRGKHHD